MRATTATVMVERFEWLHSRGADLNNVHVLRPLTHSNSSPWDIPARQEEPLSEFIPSRKGFIGLLTAYQNQGGTIRSEDLSLLRMNRSQSKSAPRLQALLSESDVFGYEWNHTLWIPMFQFEAETLLVKTTSRQVVQELSGHFDGWRLANWFIQPNEELEGQCPLHLLDESPEAVYQAARTDRYVAAG
jgi:hypothetical protein